MGTSAKTSGEEKENNVNMASAPSSPRLPTALSATESTNSTPHISVNPNPNPNQMEGDAVKNGGLLHPDEVKSHNDDGLDHLDSKQCIERFRNYENEFIHRLLAKYFSGNNLNGGNSFYEEITIGDEVIIKASRVPCFQIYADPVVGFKEQCSNESSSPAETQDNTPNGKSEEGLK